MRECLIVQVYLNLTAILSIYLFCTLYIDFLYSTVKETRGGSIGIQRVFLNLGSQDTCGFNSKILLPYKDLHYYSLCPYQQPELLLCPASLECGEQSHLRKHKNYGTGFMRKKVESTGCIQQLDDREVTSILHGLFDSRNTMKANGTTTMSIRIIPQYSPYQPKSVFSIKLHRSKYY